MRNLKSVKQTAQTFTMTFEFSNQDELKTLKALSILLGNYNPMKDEIANHYSVIDILQKEKDEGNLYEIINSVSKHLK
jgi:hypothetical protein